ncbi:MAG: threonine/serine exporter family protein [Firmicutes bacterium]|nr:threonine/serine exporter family protein [Bacillota bacterium]
MTAVSQLICSVIACLGFAIIFNIQKDKLFWACFGGFISWGVYLSAVACGLGDYLSAFIAAAVTTLYAELMARVCKTPATVFVIVCTIPLLPGGALYRAMDYLVHHYKTTGETEGIYAFCFAASMAAGIICATLTTRALLRPSSNTKQE